MFKLTKPLKFGSVAKSYTCDGRELIGDKMELQYIYIYILVHLRYIVMTYECTTMVDMLG